jgi:hypothetical protein
VMIESATAITFQMGIMSIVKKALLDVSFFYFCFLFYFFFSKYIF